jgi:cyclic pyranopterin phosphate synthase
MNNDPITSRRLPAMNGPASTGATHVPQLRYEVNFRCGKECGYCRPGGEGPSEHPGDLLSVAEARDLIWRLADRGITDVKLTGGDPALRRDIVELVTAIAAIPAVKSLHLVTRHQRAGHLAAHLFDAGLDLLNFSIDSLDPNTWAWIVDSGARRGNPIRIAQRVAEHAELVAAVRQAAATGGCMKLNTVVMKGINTGELPALVAFAGELGSTLKLLDLIDDLDAFDQGFGKQYYIDPTELIDEIRMTAVHEDWDYQPGEIGHPMRRFEMPNGATVVVKSASEGAFYNLDDVCGGCPYYPCHDALMALRLTPSGKLQRCLLRDDNLVDLRNMCNRPHDERRLAAEIDAAIRTFSTASYHAYGGHRPSPAREPVLAQPVVMSGRRGVLS